MKEKKLPLHLALIPIIVIITFGLLSVMKWKAGMNMPIVAGIVSAGLIGIISGISWNDLQKSLVEGVSRALPAIFIVIIIGAIIGSWIQGGVIPALIYYSLKIISPTIFLPATALVTAVISLATGTSFTAVATIGLALMATGLGMGFPAPLLAGSIISGAYFGDSISPLSDTTNLASAVSDTDLFDLLQHLAKTGIPALIISLAIYFLLGLKHSTSANIDLNAIGDILSEINMNFTITPLLLLIPILTIIFSIKRVPALPSLLMVAILGGIAGMVLQDISFGNVLVAMTNGYVSETGNEMIDSLLTRGGINSMGGTVILLSMATAFGGILERIGALDSILDVIMGKINSDGRLVSITVLSSLVVSFATGAQLLAIIIPARMFGNAYKERNLHPKNLGRIAQSVGTICINLVPWSVPALFAQNILGVNAVEFIPYIFFAHLTIIINILYGYTGFTMEALEETK